MDFLKVSAIYRKDELGFEIKNINFTIEQFSKTAIAGATGSGKSTLLKIIGGLAHADAGVVLFRGEKVANPLDTLIPGHKGIAYLSQHFELRNNYRVEEILSYGNTLDEDEAQNIYKICRINHLLKRRTNQISGGERQRIALTRLLVTSPKLLLLDEPFSNLDFTHKTILKSVIEDISETLQLTCILVSHDPQDVLSWAENILIIQNGAVIQQGSPKEIYKKPVNEYAAGLFGKYILLPGSVINYIVPGGKNLFVRSSQCTVNGTQKPVLKGVVKKISFAGDYYEVDIVINQHFITIKTATDNLKVDQPVTVSIQIPEEPWFI
ncbi:MAG: ABC transporter ATP-binding protein [Agriterribacter sp.]